MAERLVWHGPEHSQPGKSVEAAPHKHNAHKEPGPHKHEHKQTLEDIQATIAQEATSGYETALESDSLSDQETDHPLWVDKHLEQKALRDVLRQTRRHLSLPERSFSKLIHKNSVDKLSSGLGKTVARPSGLLGAGLAALAGSLVLFIISSRFGYEYRFSAFVWLLGIGFFVGLVIELLGLLARKK